jgi:hypothetical protein
MAKFGSEKTVQPSRNHSTSGLRETFSSDWMFDFLCFTKELPINHFRHHSATIHLPWEGFPRLTSLLHGPARNYSYTSRQVWLAGNALIYFQ